MPVPYDLIIRGGVCVLPWGMEQISVGVRDGRIATLGVAADATAHQVIDAAGLHVLPGLMDPHVHLRDPGNAAVESIPTGTKAAVLGGLTAVFDMPNTKPPCTTAEMVAWKQQRIEDTAWCDMGFYVGAARDNVAELATLELERGVCAIKCFAGSSTGNLMIEDDATLEQVMLSGFRRIGFHAEDEYRLQERRRKFQFGEPYCHHMLWRDEETAFLGTRRLMALARKTGRQSHILHVTTAQELAYLKDFRDVATCEVLANHLSHAAPEVYERLKGFGVMNPPIRGREHLEAAWAAVRDGTVDTIGSDHAPHARDAKEKPWLECPSGMVGIQTVVSVMLNHVNEGRLSLPRLVDCMSAGVARVYGVLGKGRLAAGYDADFTLVDMRAKWRIENDWIVTPAGWTPFAGMAVTGKPVGTIIRGAVVMRDGEVLGEPHGKLVRFASVPTRRGPH